MSGQTTAPQRDPVVDAYQQASAHDSIGPGAQLRASVLEYAREQARLHAAQANQGDQATPHIAPATPAIRGGVAPHLRDAPPANESSPVWRLAAGVLIGLLGVWLFQLLRPAVPDTANVAVSAPATKPADTTIVSAADTRTPVPVSSDSRAVPNEVIAMAQKKRHEAAERLTASAAKSAGSANAMPAPATAAASPPAPVATAMTAAAAPATVDALSAETAIATAAPATAYAARSELGGLAAASRKLARAPNATDKAETAPAPFPAAAAAAAAAVAASADSAPRGAADAALFTALRNGDATGVRNALNNSARAAAKDESGTPAIVLAVQLQREDLVRLLLASGAAVNAQDAKGVNALGHARALGSSVLIGALQAAGAR